MKYWDVGKSKDKSNILDPLREQSALISDTMDKPGAGIMEADYRQVTTTFTVQPSFHHPHSTNRVS